MRDLFNHPIQPGPFTVHTLDGISGVESELGDDRYLDPSQKESGWPAIHLYSFRHADNWSPQAARKNYEQWILWSLPAGCDCSRHWEKTLELFPLEQAITCPTRFFEWTVNVRNEVNKRIGRPQVPLARAREIWSRIAAAGPVAWFRPVNDTVKSGDRLVITLATGKAREWLRYTEGPMRAYAEACGADFVVLRNTTQGWWGLEKFRVHEYAKAYKQTLFLDTDILVTRSARDIFAQQQADVAIYDETGDIPNPDWLPNAWRKVTRCLGIPDHDEFVPDDSPRWSNRYGRSFNSGVVLCSREGASVWTPPPLPIPTDLHVAEQIVVGFNLMHFNPKIQLLCQTQNLQSWNRFFKLRLYAAEFVHLSGLDKKTEAIKTAIELLQTIGNPVFQGSESCVAHDC